MIKKELKVKISLLIMKAKSKVKYSQAKALLIKEI